MCLHVLYRHIPHHNDTIIKTQEDFFNNIYLSLYCKGSKKLCGVLLWEMLETEHNWNILTPLLWPSRCVFLILWCSTGGQEATLLGDGFLYGILSASSPDLNSSGPKGPFGLVWLSLPHLVYNSVRSSTQLPATANCPCHCQLPQLPSWLRYIIVQRLHDRPLDFWNRMFNRHQAEITVMQFTGHSLPVHQSMSVSWALPCPISSANFRPRDFLS